MRMICSPDSKNSARLRDVQGSKDFGCGDDLHGKFRRFAASCKRPDVSVLPKGGDTQYCSNMSL